MRNRDKRLKDQARVPHCNATAPKAFSAQAVGAGLCKRTVLARIPTGKDELVVTLHSDRVDIRVHTPTGGLRFPSKNGLTVKHGDLPALIEALQHALTREEAA
jgi:hypothetical protein